ncbi:protoporphyrinogen oxidase [Alkalihalobacillus sp. AL-G]|uniref:protoporphyrinogen oxidase n=1 Tax=Alkalihalobacillus sp. AL-G TaxID=2926399 RepID=UPI00272B34C2|nr:protoporphyrinogen oxidase [Alkalihalobacillus sp. AL-G]WLD94095.1 protoporphyrinogen oxidase [Alkalihalobacillus sp. AL-G]
MKRIVIVGGGITGLSAAFYLQKEINEKKMEASVTLVESGNRLGGKIQTIKQDGFVIERGPDSFLARKKSMSNLIEEAGLADELVHNQTGQAYILHDTKLHPIPEGAVMGIPTEVSPFVKSGLFSLKGKARAGFDLFLPSKKVVGDQAVGTFFRRRLGDEVVDHLIEPLLSGIYAGNIDQLSLQSTFPQFQQVEEQHRSLILGMKSNRPKKQPKSSKGVFLTLKSGLTSLVEALEKKLTVDVEIRKNQKVTSFEKSNETYKVRLDNGDVLDADQVIFTIPALKAAPLFVADIQKHLEEAPATSVATIAMAFPESAVPNDLNGTGFVVSRKSPYTITACTWTNKKWPHTTPEGYVLLRCYVGKAEDQSIVDESDETILKAVLDDLKETMNIQVRPEFYYVSRWKQAMPQYLVGHKSKRDLLEKKLGEKFPGIHLVGASFDGIGLPDCVQSGEKAANKVIEKIKAM